MSDVRIQNHVKGKGRRLQIEGCGARLGTEYAAAISGVSVQNSVCTRRVYTRYRRQSAAVRWETNWTQNAVLNLSTVGHWHAVGGQQQSKQRRTQKEVGRPQRRTPKAEVYRINGRTQNTEGSL